MERTTSSTLRRVGHRAHASPFGLQFEYTSDGAPISMSVVGHVVAISPVHEAASS